MPSRRGLVAVLLMLACAAAPHALADDGSWRGMPLRDALRRLEREGLRLLFSSAVVRHGMQVTVEPESSDPRAILEAILPPLGLRTQEGPGGAILILAAEPGGPHGLLRGRVLSVARGTPVSGARVTIPAAGLSTESRPDGSFEIPLAPAGSCEVTVTAPGYQEAFAGGIRIPEGGSAHLEVRLESGPHLVEEVVVTPIRHALVPPDQDHRYTIDRDDALLVPDAGGDVSRVVELLPGVTGGDNTAAFNARGSQTRDVSLVLDGLELYEPFHLESLQSPFSLIDSRNIDRIEFLGGGFTADLGDRHGGFVELSTSSPHQASETHVEAGTINSRVSYTAPTPFGSVLLSGRAWYPQALRETIEAGENGLAPRFGDAYVKMTFHAGPRMVLSAHGLAAYDRVRFFEPGGAESVRLDNHGGYLWIRAMTALGRGLLGDTVLSAGELDQSRQGLSDPDSGPIQVRDERALDFFGVKHDMSWEIGESQLLRGGIQVRPLRSNYTYETTASGISSLTRIQPDGTSLSFYLAHRASLTDHFATEVGLRWDRQNYTHDSQLSPRLNAVWRLTERTELRLGLGRYYQSQRINELHLEDGETDFLPAELAEQAALTFQHRFDPGLRLRVDAYSRSISRVHPRFENLFNPIEIFPETESDRVRIAPESARMQGIELLLQGAEQRPFHWWASYALSRAEDLAHGVVTPRSWDETHAGKFLVGYRREDRWSLALTGVAHTGWPTTPVTGILVSDPMGGTSPEPVVGSRNHDRLPPYLRFDLKASRGLALQRGTLRLNLEILNLTNRRNACCVDRFDLEPLPGGGVAVDRVLDYWLGTTGTFSLSYEF